MMLDHHVSPKRREDLTKDIGRLLDDARIGDDIDDAAFAVGLSVI